MDAFTTPKLALSLATYRKQYGLPPCTVASGCLRIVNQKGKPSPLPQSGKPFGWDVETALDVEMVSAACPHCHILLVEGNTPDLNDLAAAVKTAGRLGAQVISNSYGLAENGFTQPSAGAYQQSGHMTVVASGDGGFGPADFPANLPGVVAVGGTEMSRSHTARGWTERVWNTNGLGATASGCSAYVAKPSWQHDAHCPMRTLNDVSALAEGVVGQRPGASRLADGRWHQRGRPDHRRGIRAGRQRRERERRQLVRPRQRAVRRDQGRRRAPIRQDAGRAGLRPRLPVHGQEGL